jgi:hypothetical protein
MHAHMHADTHLSLHTHTHSRTCTTLSLHTCVYPYVHLEILSAGIPCTRFRYGILVQPRADRSVAWGLQAVGTGGGWGVKHGVEGAARKAAETWSGLAFQAICLALQLRSPLAAASHFRFPSMPWPADYTLFIWRSQEKIVCIIRAGQGLPLKGFSTGDLGLQQTPAPRPHHPPVRAPGQGPRTTEAGGWLGCRACTAASLAPPLVLTDQHCSMGAHRTPNTRQRAERV